MLSGMELKMLKYRENRLSYWLTQAFIFGFLLLGYVIVWDKLHGWHDRLLLVLSFVGFGIANFADGLHRGAENFSKALDEAIAEAEEKDRDN
jgi:hypothetical protein